MNILFLHDTTYLPEIVNAMAKATTEQIMVVMDKNAKFEWFGASIPTFPVTPMLPLGEIPTKEVYVKPEGGTRKPWRERPKF